MLGRKNKTLIVPDASEKSGPLYGLESLSPSVGAAIKALGVALEKAENTENNLPMPGVIEKTPNGERGIDLITRLLQDRVILVAGQVNDGMATSVTAQLMYLDAAAPGQEIRMFINSPGGSVTAGLAIYDAMQYIKSPIRTICNGIAMSMGSVILCGGSPGLRFATPNSSIMIHQPSGGGGNGSFRDQQVSMQFGLGLENRLYQIYERHTGIPADQIVRMIRAHDFYLSNNDAVRLGFIDDIVDGQECENGKPKSSYRAPKREIPAGLVETYTPPDDHIKPLGPVNAPVIKAGGCRQEARPW